MKQFRIVAAWAGVMLIVITAMDNLFVQPPDPGQFVGGADLAVALMVVIVVLDRVHHVFDVRK